MQQPVQSFATPLSLARPASVAELIADSSLCLPGSTLTHIFHVISPARRSRDPHEQDAARQVLAYLAGQDAKARDISHTRCRHLLTQTIVLDGIGERSARALREALLAIDGVLRVRLEHHLVRGTRQSAPSAEPVATAETSAA